MDFISHIYTIGSMYQCLTIHHINDLGLQQFVKEKKKYVYALLCVCKGNSFQVHIFLFFYLLSNKIIPS
jgi:hypothetical protein